ncbi:hypothetical protein M427DRAFT_142767 [Gonapodya prolifera JEL478]|uniref:Uncharacterized protein n=1 Tax=Gonapodya prolifera (strain JEL478) TaxID=1344416 RepID=A0A139AUX1_GONPJ|nr:hypothetical protein M427DRAFT_142767 [Gonapodya prolifera JEL478]|eukprot:KXS20518.1 hypothetical protein M427DRAFT_142767 [Gonapodya prolifera JEL478]
MIDRLHVVSLKFFLAYVSLLLFVPLSRSHFASQIPFHEQSSPSYYKSLSNPSLYKFFGVTLLRIGGHCDVLQPLDVVQHHRLLVHEDDVQITERPRVAEREAVESVDSEDDKVIEVVGRSADRVRATAHELCSGNIKLDFHETPAYKKPDNDEGDVIIPIVSSGPPSNRIDVVFMGDGYTKQEEERFISDIKRLVEDMFAGETFRSVLPFFNLWAVYRPSKESGIGVGGIPKGTSFGLYRDGTELRGIYCSKPRQAREACRGVGPQACDYPTIIGNDDFYGGLGGEFVISTRSFTSGTVVLRHEMGHNFVRVGEEYDGGYVYEGVNSARSLAALGWGHWLSDGNDSWKEQHSQIRIQDYSWYNLAKGPYRLSFTTNGKFPRWWLKFSASGMDGDDLEVLLDGKRMPWKSCGILDRWLVIYPELVTQISHLCGFAFLEFSFYDVSNFYNLNSSYAFPAGTHTFEFRLSKTAFSKKTRPAPIHQLCSVTMLEYGSESEFVWDDLHISAYQTWSISNKKTYRPSNEGCLMRNMSSPRFCSVCKEGMWMQFLRRVDIIDGLDVGTECTARKEALTTMELQLLPFAQFRKTPLENGQERYHISWFHEGIVVPTLKDTTNWTLPNATGHWKVRVQLETSEVRHDPNELLVAERDFHVQNC